MSKKNNLWSYYHALRYRRSRPRHQPAPGMTLLAFLALSGVIFVAISGWSFLSSYQRQLGEAEHSVMNLSVAMSRQAEDTFLPVELAIGDILRRIDGNISTLDSEKIKNILNEHRALLPQLMGFYLFDDRGNLLASTRDGGEQVPIFNASNRDYFILHKQYGKDGLYIGRTTISYVTNLPVIPISLRISGADGTFKGVFVATIDQRYFSKFYSYFNLDSSTVISLLNLDGNAVFFHPGNPRYTGQNFSSGTLLSKAVKKSPGGYGIWRTRLDSQVRIVGYQQLKRYPLVMVASVEKAALQRRWLADNLPAMLLNAVVLLAMLALGWRVLNQVRLTVLQQRNLSKLHQEETDKNLVLQQLALLDPLTRLANRRLFDRYLEQSLAQVAEDDQLLSLIMLDVDFFKRYNDTYGHVEGDQCLGRIATALNGLPLPADALVARYGGEEFAVILPHVTGEQAAEYGEAMVAGIRELAIPHVGSKLPQQRVTVSVGVYARSSSNLCDGLLLKEGADQALYLAKQQGRDRCVRI